MPAIVLGPLIALIAAWAQKALVGAGVVYVFDLLNFDDLKKSFYDWIVKTAAERAGLVLDSDDPMSEASLTNAVSSRIGIPIRSLKNPATLKEDVEAFAAALVSSKTGYQINSVSDVAVLKADLERVALTLLSGRLGIPLADFPGVGADVTVDSVRAPILAWAKAQLFARLGEEAGLTVAEIQSMGDIEGLAVTMNNALTAMNSVESVTARKLALVVADNLATKAITSWQRVATGSDKRQRRQMQLQQAQAKFRATHGNRVKYIPLGMGAIIG